MQTGTTRDSRGFRKKVQAREAKKTIEGTEVADKNSRLF